MTRSYTLSGIYAYSRPISQAIAKAFNATDRNSLVLVETQQLLLGECHFSALPDTVPIDINIFWAAESRWYYDIFAVTGASLEEAVSKMHQQGTDTTLGTLTADINMGAFSLVWKAALANGEYCGITEAGIAGATLVFGNLIYQANTDSRWEKVDANATVSASVYAYWPPLPMVQQQRFFCGAKSGQTHCTQPFYLVNPSMPPQQQEILLHPLRLVLVTLYAS
jgi:hypothetical protein